MYVALNTSSCLLPCFILKNISYTDRSLLSESEQRILDETHFYILDSTENKKRNYGPGTLT